MLVMSKGALSLDQAETYYQEKYSEDDYYTESHRVAGEWYGKAAETLGLSGAVSEEDFRTVLRGMKPGTSAVLVSAAAGRDERRAGWDATFNAPKSVSIQALVGEDARLIDAHRRAVERALSELEKFAQARDRRSGITWRSNRSRYLAFVSRSRLYHPGDGGGGARKPRTHARWQRALPTNRH